jgi:Lipase maturation factor
VGEPAQTDEDAVAAFRDGPLRRFLAPRATYLFTRFAVLRLLGLVYFVAFFSAVRQVGPLIGHRGLLPADALLAGEVAEAGSRSAAFWEVPTLFVWTRASDAVLLGACWVGTLLSLAVLAGVTHAGVQLALWALYLSLVQVGQIFYGYGWEYQLLETGFLAVFLCPLRSFAPFPETAPPPVVSWLLRWLAFRVMLGAGLIKLRGDPCWRDLTCLVYHYETQPVPSPLSYLLHALPRAVHQGGVLVNHLVEIGVPWFAFGPRRARHVAGVLLVAFQVVLILSGNLSFLNWLTIVPALACFDDSALGRLFPAAIRARTLALAERAEPGRLARRVSFALAAVVAVLSVQPVLNLLSPGQAMNASFDRLHLVNTYGAFGSVGRERFEVILEGTSDAVLGDHTVWRAYELPCKPGDVRRRPCMISPYHYRLDWQMWFAAFTGPERQPWLVHLVYQLLRGEPGVKRLLAGDPFPEHPPRYVRGELYKYRFTRPGDGSGAWWERTRVASYLRPLSVDDPALVRIVEARGWAGK